MGRRIGKLIRPELKQTMMRGECPQQVRYLYISDRFGKRGLRQVLKDGGEQFQDTAALAEKKQTPHFITVTADKEEEGYLAVSLLAGIYGERNMEELGEDNGDAGFDRDCEWEDSSLRIPVINYAEASRYFVKEQDTFFPFENTFQAGRQTNSDYVPYWTAQSTMPVCIRINYSELGNVSMADTLKSFEDNRQVYLLIVKTKGGWRGSDFLWEDITQDSINELVLTFTAEEVCIPKKRSVSQYYENVWRQMVREHGYRLGRGFRAQLLLQDIEKMNQDFSYGQLEKILRYAIRGKEGTVLTETDFSFMERFVGKSRVAEKEADETRSALRRLREDLVGLEQVKEQVEETVQILKFNRIRQKMGVETKGYHNVHMMLGAPGTAKTTVARIMGEIMAEEELLPGRQFACVNGAELKGMYVGHSAPKTKALFEDNDIIVIDEAYSLAGNEGEPDSFSREAVAQLVIELEEHAMDKLVIFAGYGGSDVEEKHNKMKEFIDCNPGIKSRINSTFHFKSYCAREMTEIFSKHAQLNQYLLPEGYEEMVEAYFEKRTQDDNFGNGREARALFEKVTVQMAKRVLGGLGGGEDEKAVAETEVKQCFLEDIRTALERAEYENRQTEGKKVRRAIGF